jgi:hypothetical protein
MTPIAAAQGIVERAAEKPVPEQHLSCWRRLMLAPCHAHAEGAHVWETGRSREGLPLVEAVLKAKHYDVLLNMLDGDQELLAEALRLAKRCARTPPDKNFVFTFVSALVARTQAPLHSVCHPVCPPLMCASPH